MSLREVERGLRSRNLIQIELELEAKSEWDEEGDGEDSVWRGSEIGERDNYIMTPISTFRCNSRAISVSRDTPRPRGRLPVCVGSLLSASSPPSAAAVQPPCAFADASLPLT